MDLSSLVQAVIVYMKDHYPTTPQELNFHAELKADSQWCWSDDYHKLVMKKVPVDDCRLNIAGTATLRTCEKEEKYLRKRTEANKKDKGNDSSDESADEQLLGVSGSPWLARAIWTYLFVSTFVTMCKIHTQAIPS